MKKCCGLQTFLQQYLTTDLLHQLIFIEFLGSELREKLNKTFELVVAFPFSIISIKEKHNYENILFKQFKEDSSSNTQSINRYFIHFPNET